MQVQDDLAFLFSRNLSLQSRQHEEPLPLVQTQPAMQQHEPITYSITQHYHHSAHLASKFPKAASEPSITDQETTEIILGRHGVDVKTLSPSQVDLFKSADPSQQMRLVELWRISPPNYGGHALAQDIGSWSATSLEQEEAMAKLRYERQMLEERASRVQGEEHPQLFDHEDVMSDGEQSNAPLTPIQGGDSRWSGSHAPEPYMASGYEMLAQREYEMSTQRPSKDVYSHFESTVGGPSYTRSNDPVYNSVEQNHHESWGRTPEQQMQAMENVYGMFAHSHDYSFGAVQVGGEDEEML